VVWVIFGFITSRGMGTGAESPGLSCPLDVDLFPAYSDDSPLCDCSFGIPGVRGGFRFCLFFFLLASIASSLGLHLPRIPLLSCCRKVVLHGHSHVHVVSVLSGFSCLFLFFLFFFRQHICYWYS